MGVVAVAVVESSTFLVWGLLSLVDICMVYLCEPLFNIGIKVLFLTIDHTNC